MNNKRSKKKTNLRIKRRRTERKCKNINVDGISNEKNQTQIKTKINSKAKIKEKIKFIGKLKTKKFSKDFEE